MAHLDQVDHLANAAMNAVQLLFGPPGGERPRRANPSANTPSQRRNTKSRPGPLTQAKSRYNGATKGPKSTDFSPHMRARAARTRPSRSAVRTGPYVCVRVQAV